jgi:2-aminoadipate transaminase
MAQAALTSSPTWSALLSKRASDLPARPRLDDPENQFKRISFTYGFPDGNSLPSSAVANATVRALEERGHEALQYGSATGVPRLIQVLLDKLRRDQGIEAKPENVLITAGGSQAVQIVLDALIDWGDTVVTEEPTWMGALRAFKNVGARPVPVPLDGEGTDVVALERELKRLRGEGITPKLIYVIPNFQNPTGVSTTRARRERIAALAAEYGTMVFEDDAYSDLRYAGERIPPIYALDRNEQTLYLGTLSKVMGAGMRIGWLLGPAAFIQKLAVLKIDGCTNVFGSHVAAEWLPEHLTEHIVELRAIYKRRSALMVESLARHMPEGTTWTTPEGGFFVWVTLPEGLDTARLVVQARERGIEFLSGRQCWVSEKGDNTLRLSFSFARDEQIDRGIGILGEIVRGELMELGRA